MLFKVNTNDIATAGRDARMNNLYFDTSSGELRNLENASSEKIAVSRFDQSVKNIPLIKNALARGDIFELISEVRLSIKPPRRNLVAWMKIYNMTPGTPQYLPLCREFDYETLCNLFQIYASYDFSVVSAKIGDDTHVVCQGRSTTSIACEVWSKFYANYN